MKTEYFVMLGKKEDGKIVKNEQYSFEQLRDLMPPIIQVPSFKDLLAMLFSKRARESFMMLQVMRLEEGYLRSWKRLVEADND